MEEDPAFYRKFSEMLEDAIRAFRERRLADTRLPGQCQRDRREYPKPWG